MTDTYDNDEHFDSHSLAHRIGRALATSDRVPVRSVVYYPRRGETHPAATIVLPNSTWCVIGDAWGTTPTTGRGCLDINVYVKTDKAATGSNLATLVTMQLNANARPDVEMDVWDNWAKTVISNTLASI